MNDSIQNNTDTVTLNIEPFLGPLAMIISAAILSTGFIIGMGNLNGLKIGSTTTTGTTTTPTPTTDTPTPGATLSLDTVNQIFEGNYIKFGDPSSSVLFVEVSDPSCPYCHIAGGKNPELNKSVGPQFTLTQDGGTYVAPIPEMKKLVDEGKAAFAWIYTNGHGNGEMGTKAMYCAYDQGKFWEVHDLLMSSAGYSLLNDTVKNDKTKSGVLVDFVKNVVNTNELKDCLDSGKYDSRITTENNYARTLPGFQGTPTLIVNDQVFPGAYSWVDMQSTVDGFLQ